MRWASTPAPTLFCNRMVNSGMLIMHFNLLREATLYKYMSARISQLTAVLQRAYCLRQADHREHEPARRSLFVKSR